MDLVDYSEEIYEKIKDEFSQFSYKLDVKDVHFIPISALKGDNVVERSDSTPWYDGTTLLYYLENVHIGSDHNFIDCRFPVQYVIRPNTDQYHDYRGYSGRVAGGVFKKGDNVMVLPSGFTSKIAKIDTFDGELEEAFPPSSVTILLEDEIDISRGDMIVRENNSPTTGQDIDLMVCWFNDNRPLKQRDKFIIRHTTQELRCIIKEVRYKMNVNTLHRDQEDKTINMNDIARITIRTTKPLYYDSYRRNRITGSLLFVDENTNETVGAGMII